MDKWIAVRQFPVEQDLTPLIIFLRERGISHRISEVAGEQVLSVSNALDVAPVKELLQAFERGEVVLQSVNPSITTTIQREAVPQGIPFAIQLKLFPVVFISLILSLLGWVIATTQAGQFLLHWFTFQDFTYSGYIPLAESLSKGELWRLITPTFLHFSVSHLVFNAVLLWWFGQRIEYTLGHLEFAFFILVTGIFSNFGQYFWTGTANFGGISGVIYAFIGFIVVVQKLAPQPALHVQGSMIWFMLGWLVFCMTGIVDMFMSGGGVANAAHVAGLIGGCLYGLLRAGMSRFAVR